MIWSTAFKIASLSTFVASIIILFFNQPISFWLFKSNEYDYAVIVFAIGLILFVWNSFFLAILNGLKEIKKIIIINIVTSFFNLLLTATLASFYSLYGALIALAISQSIVVFLSFYIVLKSNWFTISSFSKKIEKQALAKLGSIFLMGMVSAVTVPVAGMVIRNHLGATVSWDDAGYWDATKKISGVLVIFVTSGLALYYLPKFSEIINYKQMRMEVIQGLSIVIPVSIFFAVMIYMFRDTLILLLYTEKFMMVNSLIGFQLSGDVFFIASKLLEIVLIAKAMTKHFIYLSIIFNTLYVLLSYLFINYLQTEGVTIAYAMNQLGYFITLYFIFTNQYKKHQAVTV